MQYALLIYHTPGYTDDLAADEQQAVHRTYLELKDLPEMVGGAALHPASQAMLRLAAIWQNGRPDANALAANGARNG